MSWTMMVMRAGQVKKTNKKYLHSSYYTLICKEHVDSIGSERSPLIWNVLKTVPFKKKFFSFFLTWSSGIASTHSFLALS